MKLVSKAWGQVPTTRNAVSGFQAMGIVLLDNTAIQDHAFISDKNMNEPQQNETIQIQ